MKKILVIQTAFAGDLILTLPLIQAARDLFAPCAVDVLCIPGTADLLRNHPSVARIFRYDKRRDRLGAALLTGWRSRLRDEGYDIVFCPHRSLRSALLARASRASRRVAFTTSAGGAFCFTDLAPYQPERHEIDRVCSLLIPLGIEPPVDARPRLYPGPEEAAQVDAFLRTEGLEEPFICLAPGSVWATKRWLPEGFASLARAFVEEGWGVVLVGGASDRELCAQICSAAREDACRNAAGTFGFLATAELVRRARLLVSNDSAPVHIASAVGTPVVDIFGPTSPDFGFAPYGVPHRIVVRGGLPCHPCEIHGGDRCPDARFDFACMKELTWRQVHAAARELLA